MGIEGLKTVSSNSSQGVANITCEFELNRNIDVALQQVQTRIAQVQNRLPVKLYPPVITKTNPEDQPLLWVMVSADDSVPLYQQMIYSRNTLKDQLSSLNGVGNVVLGGYVDPNLRVWIDAQKMYGFDLTSSDVVSAIQAEQSEQPAGRIEDPAKEYNIRVMGEASTAPDFARIRINNRGGGPNYNPIALSQVAKVEEGISDLRAISRYNGKTAVGLGIVKQHGANAVEVANQIYKKVDQMRASLLPGYHVDVRLDTTRYIPRLGGGTELHPAVVGAFDLGGVLLVFGFVVIDLQRAVGHPDFDRGHVHRVVFLRLHAEHLHPVGTIAGHRHRGRRRDHDAGKHRAPSRDGQNQAPGVAGRRA